MKFNFDKKYIKICRYVGITIILVYLAIRLIDSVPYISDNIFGFIGGVWNISFPIILGFIIAYLMLGPVNSIEKLLTRRKFFKKRRKAARGIGITISYIGVIALVISLICGLYFMIGGQISQNSTFTNIIDSISDYYSKNSLSSANLAALIEKLNIPFGGLISSKVDDIAAFIHSAITWLISGLADIIFAIGSNLFSLVISITFSIYVIASQEYFKRLFDKLFFMIFKKSNVGILIRRSIRLIDSTFSNYIRGQLIEACIVAVLSTVVLMIVGVDYSVIIGFICGICNLIPYIGPFIGIAIAAVLALFSGEILRMVFTILGLFIVQQIDCNILCPRIVGNVVGLHPAWVIIAITVGGNLYGLIGMLIAVPVMASIKNLFSDWYDRYMKDSYEEYAKNKEQVDESEGIFESVDIGSPIKKVKSAVTTVAGLDDTDSEDDKMPDDASDPDTQSSLSDAESDFKQENH